MPSAAGAPEAGVLVPVPEVARRGGVTRSRGTGANDRYVKVRDGVIHASRDEHELESWAVGGAPHLL